MPPLTGLKVVEMARVLAGPWAGQILADLGAEVIKVESLAGDETRAWGPPWIDNADGSRDAAYFHSCNRGKQSIAVDFASEAGRQIVTRLIAGADVVVENFKVGTPARYGFDYVSARGLNPRIVYCSITGFGQDGPYRERPGYDFVVQAMGGIMDLTGDPSGPPEKIGVAYADVMSGLYAVIAIQAALAHRARTGEGQAIDMALLDTLVGTLANQAMNYLVSGTSPRRLGNAHPNIVPYQEFPTSDGAVIVAVGNDAQFRQFVRAIGAPALAERAEYGTNSERVAHRVVLVDELKEITVRFPRAALLAMLEEAGVPVGPINSVADVFADPQVIHRGMRLDLPRGDGGAPIPSVRTPIVMDGSPPAYHLASPRLGEHTASVLAGLGYRPAEIEQFRLAKVTN